MEKLYPNRYMMYGTGGAFSFSPFNDGVILVAAPRLPGISTQGPVKSGEKVYNWNERESVFLDINDLLGLSFLANTILAHKNPIAKNSVLSQIYHEYKGVGKTLTITNMFDANNNLSGYLMTLRTKNLNTAETRVVASHSLRPVDIAFMSSIFPLIVYDILGWREYKPANNPTEAEENGDIFQDSTQAEIESLMENFNEADSVPHQNLNPPYPEENTIGW